MNWGKETNPFTEFLCDPNVVNKKMPNHIDFEGETRAAKHDFSSKLTAQIQLQLLCTTGSKNVCLECLQEAPFSQEEYLFLRDTIERYEECENSRPIPVRWCISCITYLQVKKCFERQIFVFFNFLAL